MKILQWVILIKRNPGQLYLPVAAGRFLSAVAAKPSGSMYEPVFGDDPILYPRRIARFQASELRRVGYNVRSVPYVLLMLVNWIKARKLKKW